MPDLLLELFSEEIPARMQAQAAKDLERLVVGALSDRGLLFEGSTRFRRTAPPDARASPAFPPSSPTCRKRRRARASTRPRRRSKASSNRRASRSTNARSATIPKGDFYVAVIQRKGRATADVLAEILPETIGKLPWPKSMRWGDGAFALGAPAAFDRRDLRRRDRAVRDRRREERQHHARPPLSIRGRDPGPPLRRLRRRSCAPRM